MTIKAKKFKKTLVTGGTGFIGSKLINYFRRTDHPYIVLTRSKYFEDSNFVTLNNLDEIPQEAFRNVDRVIHLAGISKDTKKLDFATENQYLNANVNYTKNILNSSIEEGVKSFIFISTSKVSKLDLNSSEFKKNLKKESLDIYALSKKKAENLILILSKNKTIKINILRPSIVYGPGSKGNLNLLINLIKIGLILKFKSLKNKKSLVHVDDLIKAIDFISLNGLDREIYNISGGEYNIEEISKVIADIYNKKTIKLSISESTFSLLIKTGYPLNKILKRLSKEEIHSSDKLLKLGFNFSKTLYNVDHSDF